MLTRSRTTKTWRLGAAVAVVVGPRGHRRRYRPPPAPTPPLRSDAPSGEGVIIGLITKTESNPFFVKMREGAQAKADELGVELRSFAGEFDGDNDAQVTAIEDLISAGAAGFMITPSDTVAIVPTIEEAREAGLVVIALDTPLDPIDAADATFATDNFRAGELIGAVGGGLDRGSRRGEDRHARPRREPADRRRAARPGLPHRLRHRRRRPRRVGRRGRPAHRRPRHHRRQRGRWPGRRWRTCSPSIPTSTSCTRSTSRPRPEPGWRSMPPAATP